MTIKIYYDKDCPFCHKYTQFIKLKKEHNVYILNAREYKDSVYNFRTKGFDINDGIIIQLDDNKLYQGADAIIFLDNLSEKKNYYGKFYSYVINRNIFKKYLYSMIKFIRKVLLKIAGIDPTI
jgi:predicted DCC family thiol-disulfide oxidoreductase YuxK